MIIMWHFTGLCKGETFFFTLSSQKAKHQCQLHNSIPKFGAVDIQRLLTRQQDKSVF